MTETVKDTNPEHAEAYSEMCDQFTRGVMQMYRDAARLTIMRDMPMPLQINAIIVGSMVGALVPLLLTVGRRANDEELIKQIGISLPDLIKAARNLCGDIMKAGDGI